MIAKRLLCPNLLKNQTNKSLINNVSSLDTTATSQDQASDEEDDELLALRIAALESIKIKEAKVIVVLIITWFSSSILKNRQRQMLRSQSS